MHSQKISEGVYLLRANHWDRRLFDELIPLPEGTTYNSYIIFGSEKTALIDAVDFSKEDELIEALKNIGVEKIDYIVSNHAEQDHSGGIKKLLSVYPDAKVVTNSKCKEFLMDLLLIPEDRFVVVEDGQELSLGDKTLKFIKMPWVHWPETMITYLVEDGILFTCDLFGAHYATSDVYVYDEMREYLAAKRYYAEIMMPFRQSIKKYIQRIREINPRIIAPSHGAVHKNTEFILSAYERWVSDDVNNEVLIIFVSMHGSTKKIVDYLADKISEKGIKVRYYNLTVTDVGDLLMDVVDAATIVIATPTVLTGAHPSIVSAAYLLNLLRPKTKFVAFITSYGWGSRAIEQLKSLIPNVPAEILDEITVKGYPKEEDFARLDELVEKIYEKHKEQNLIGGD